MKKDRFKRHRPKTSVSCDDIYKFFITTFPGNGSCEYSMKNVEVSKDMLDGDNQFGVWSRDICKSFHGEPYNKYILCTFNDNLELTGASQYDGNIRFYREKNFTMFNGQIIDGKLVLHRAH